MRKWEKGLVLYGSCQPQEEQNTKEAGEYREIKSSSPSCAASEGTRTKLHTHWSREENPALLTAKIPEPSASRGRPIVFTDFQGISKPAWMVFRPDQPWSELQATESWASPQRMVSCVLCSGLEHQEPPKCSARWASLHY